MQHPVPRESFAEPVQKALNAPPALRMMAARGMAPLPPAVLVAVLYLTQFDADAALATAAKATFDKLPGPVLEGALKAPDLHPAVLDLLAQSRADDRAIAERVVKHPNTDSETICFIAGTADETLCELISTNEQRLIAFPRIIESLYFNEHLRMSTADRICELAARHKIVLDIPGFEEIAKSLENALIPEAGEVTPTDEMFREALEEAKAVPDNEEGDPFVRDGEGEGVKLKEEFEKVAKRLEDMTVSEKMRTAMMGTAAQRRILACSPVRVIAEAAIRSPRIQGDEIMKLAMLPECNEVVLRQIARRGDWLKSSKMRFYLARNPKCPTPVAITQLGHLGDPDLKMLMKSKTVPAQVRNVARQIIAKRHEKRSDD